MNPTRAFSVKAFPHVTGEKDARDLHCGQVPSSSLNVHCLFHPIQCRKYKPEKLGEILRKHKKIKCLTWPNLLTPGSTGLGRPYHRLPAESTRLVHKQVSPSDRGPSPGRLTRVDLHMSSHPMMLGYVDRFTPWVTRRDTLFQGRPRMPTTISRAPPHIRLRYCLCQHRVTDYIYPQSPIEGKVSSFLLSSSYPLKLSCQSAGDRTQTRPTSPPARFTPWTRPY